MLSNQNFAFPKVCIPCLKVILSMMLIMYIPETKRKKDFETNLLKYILTWPAGFFFKENREN